MMALFYKGLAFTAQPFLRLHGYLRVLKGKEDPQRIRERFGQPSQANTNGPLIWIHGASVGETLSILPFIDRLQTFFQGTILVTSGTPASAHLLHKRLSSKCIHQYIPYDGPSWIHKFLRHWRPQMVFWFESDIWPNIFDHIHRQNIPVFFLNACMSQRSFARWRQVKSLISPLLRKCIGGYVQTHRDKIHFESLGLHVFPEVGNLKFASSPLPYDPEELKDWKGHLQNSFYWVAASFHKGEEAVIYETISRLKKSFPQCICIAVPRHPDKATFFTTYFESFGLRVQRRSETQHPTAPMPDVYMVDSFGDLGLVYSLQGLSTVFGSFAPIGGHNILEPARMKNLIVQGPQTHKSHDLTQAFIKRKACLIVSTPQELSQVIQNYWRNPLDFENYKRNAYEYSHQQHHFLTKIEKNIFPYIKKVIHGTCT